MVVISPLIGAVADLLTEDGGKHCRSSQASAQAGPVDAVTVIDEHHGCRAVFQLTDRGLGAGVQVPQRDFRPEQVNVRGDQEARRPRVLLGLVIRDQARPSKAIGVNVAESSGPTLQPGAGGLPSCP